MPNREFKERLKYTESYYIKKLLEKVKLKEIMTTKAIALRDSEPFSHVAEKFREFNIRHLPVIDQKNKLVGIVTHATFTEYVLRADSRMEAGFMIKRR